MKENTHVLAEALLALANYKQEVQNVYSIGQGQGTPYLMVISLIVQL